MSTFGGVVGFLRVQEPDEMDAPGMREQQLIGCSWGDRRLLARHARTSLGGPGERAVQTVRDCACAMIEPASENDIPTASCEADVTCLPVNFDIKRNCPTFGESMTRKQKLSFFCA